MISVMGYSVDCEVRLFEVKMPMSQRNDARSEVELNLLCYETAEMAARGSKTIDLRQYEMQRTWTLRQIVVTLHKANDYPVTANLTLMSGT